MNDVLRVIYKRRSLRRFAEKPIAEENREKLLHAAVRAPTAGNLMSYSVIDVTDPSIKEQLAKSCDDQPMIAQAPMVLVFLADMQRLYDYFRYCGVPELCEKEGLPYTTPEEGNILLAANDAIVAAQNVVIAAESMGMGSCYIGDVIENIEIHRDLLSLPQWTFPVAMLIVGYPPANEDKEPVSRFPIRFIVHRNRYRLVADREFDAMFHPREVQRPAGAPYLEPAANLGQHIYLRKFASEFMAELRRFFKKGLQVWTTRESLEERL